MCNPGTGSGFRNESAEIPVYFSPKALIEGLRVIYNKDIDVRTEIETHIFEETLRRFNEATAQGLAESVDPEIISDRFLYELRTNNAVFSAFKTHRMQNDIAAQLIDPVTGQLKSFDKWKRDIKGMTDHYVHSWLQTEYNTAVIRAQQAADWKHFLDEADVFPNVRWMPTTSLTPDPLHERFWTLKLTLPVNHPFWQEHRPGDRWNCKCSLQQTDEPVNAAALEGYTPPLPMPGLDNNPANDGALFSRSHPYYTEAHPGAAEASAKAVESVTHKWAKTEEAKRRIMKESEKLKMEQRRELYQQYKDDPNYKDVIFDEKSGGLSAIHKDHKFSSAKSLLYKTKKQGDYEKEATNALRRKGHLIILASEDAKTGVKTPDGYLDGSLMDIKSFEGTGKWKVKDKLKEATIQGVKTVVLYFPKKELYSFERVNDGWYYFMKDDSSQRLPQTIKRVVCVIEDEVIEYSIPK